MGKARKKVPAGNIARGLTVDALLFWLALVLLAAVPLAFSTLVYTKYSLPKFVVLITGSSVLAILLVLNAARLPAEGTVRLRSGLVRIVYLYFAAVGISTIFGVAPLASLFGSHFNYMGLITRLCFLIVFVALITGIGASEKRLRAALWVIVATGFLVGAYGVAQSFGIEPFVSRALYTFKSTEGPLVRVSATLGHSNYLGNFLLYTTPVSVGLAVTGKGWLRGFATAAAVLSTGAIVFSGTRGAWIGLAAGGVTYALFELRSGAASVVRSHPLGLAAGLLLAMLLALIVAIGPASRSAGERLRALMSEGASSSGRTLLWRDSLGMVPSFSVFGCGPEGFRKAFLGFKSKELAQLSPKANNESPHSAYLEAVISHGIAGAALYAAMICASLTLLVRARRRFSDRHRRLLIAGLVSSMVAALVHNIFIFDQIATGLYFFAFIALAQAVSNVAPGGAPNSRAEKKAKELTQSKQSTARWKWSMSSRVLVSCAAPLIVGAFWYSAGLVRSELAYKELLDPTKSADFDRVVALGERITSSPLPTGAYDFVFAREVDLFVKRMAALSTSPGRVLPNNVDLNDIRVRATRLGIDHAQKSLAYTLTPELNYSVLASLALAAGDLDKLKDAAREAVRWDPKSYYARSLMAEAYMVRGERELAAREAEIALDLYHVSPEAASVLARANGEDPADQFALGERMARLRVGDRNVKRSVEELIEAARQLTQANKLTKARVKLLTASLRAGGTCPDCHRELAIVCERMGRNSEAIAQWEMFIEQAPERASTERVEARIAALRQKDRPRQ
jgi:O-antigen ligase/tetratricopeptide (TPR) repeat protein